MKLKGLTDKEIGELFPFYTVLAGWRGSIAHNMYVPSEDPDSIDDKDIMGVTIAPQDHYYGLKKFEQVDRQIGKYDVVNYELRKFIRLLSKSNPNVLSLLWLRDEHYLHRTLLGNMLIEYRRFFVSKQVYRSFTGYAWGQLKKMEHQKFEGYMGEKRKRLVEKYGYDTKNAAHLVRILRMGIEFLNEGELHVFREDAPQLIEIKRGAWSLDRVKEEADRLFKRAEDAYDRCTLPNKPDFEKINTLVTMMMQSHFGRIEDGSSGKDQRAANPDSDAGQAQERADRRDRDSEEAAQRGDGETESRP